MTKTTNAILNTIHKRRSIGNLSLPMPNDDELKTALQAAFAAPDHKQLKPWQFCVLTGDDLVKFGKLLLQAQERLSGELDEPTRQKTLNMPMRAPMIIMVATNIKAHEKVPEFEQLLSVGAAIQNLLLAFESQGYHTVWRTGLLCNEPLVKTHFCVADKDTICGFIYVGSSDVQIPTRKPVAIDGLVTFGTNQQ